MVETAETTGWRCPTCGVTWAPSVRSCQRCSPRLDEKPNEIKLTGD